MDGFYGKIISRALDDPGDLTDWEYDFLQSLADRGSTDLSDKQIAILNRIQQKLDR